MGKMQLSSDEIGSVQRNDFDITTTGQAVITKVISSTGISLSQTGVDAGTGDVTMTINLSTGKAGGQSVIGGTATGEDLTLVSTTHATKGTIILGSSSYVFDQVNNRLGLGTATPGGVLHVTAAVLDLVDFNCTTGAIPSATLAIPIAFNVSGSFTDTTSQLRALSVVATATGSTNGGALQAIGWTVTCAMTAATLNSMEAASCTISLSNAGNVSSVFGFRVIPLISSSGSITSTYTAFDARSPNCSSTGTIATSVGVNISAQKTTGVTTGVGIQQVGASDTNTFAGVTTFTNTFGYATGAGGTVTQATSKATGVTLSKQCGKITMNAAGLATATIVSFTVTNTLVAANDIVICQHDSAGTLGAYTVTGNTVAAGSFNITVRNNTGGTLSEAIVIKFILVKAVTS